MAGAKSGFDPVYDQGTYSIFMGWYKGLSFHNNKSPKRYFFSFFFSSGHCLSFDCCCLLVENSRSQYAVLVESESSSHWCRRGDLQLCVSKGWMDEISVHAECQRVRRRCVCQDDLALQLQSKIHISNKNVYLSKSYGQKWKQIVLGVGVRACQRECQVSRLRQFPILPRLIACYTINKGEETI